METAMDDSSFTSCSAANTRGAHRFFMKIVAGSNGNGQQRFTHILRLQFATHPSLDSRTHLPLTTAVPVFRSFDAGYGSTHMARIVGQKKAREIWFLCRYYSAKEALDMGLVNTVVPVDELELVRT